MAATASVVSVVVPVTMSTPCLDYYCYSGGCYYILYYKTSTPLGSQSLHAGSFKILFPV